MHFVYAYALESVGRVDDVARVLANDFRVQSCGGGWLGWGISQRLTERDEEWLLGLPASCLIDDRRASACEP